MGNSSEVSLRLLVQFLAGQTINKSACLETQIYNNKAVTQNVTALKRKNQGFSMRLMLSDSELTGNIEAKTDIPVCPFIIGISNK